MSELSKEEAIKLLGQMTARLATILATIDLQPDENVMLCGTGQPFRQSEIYRATKARIEYVEARLKDAADP